MLFVATRLRIAVLTALLLATGLLQATTAVAHDDDHHRLAGDKLSMRDPLAKPHKRKFSFRVKNQLAIQPDMTSNPATFGSSLIVRGAGVGDGDTDVLYLDTANWKAMGSKGWSYKSKVLAGTGVQKVKLKSGKSGGMLQVKAKGSSWPFVITQPQQNIEISLSIGAHVYCADFGAGDLSRNEPERIKGGGAAIPLECAAVCGNGILELGETCDDGNRDNNDTCTNTCTSCSGQVDFNSTFEGLQALLFESATYGCANDLCHGLAAQGGLSLTHADAYASLIGVPSSIDPTVLRVFPGDQDLSMLYLKIAAKTLALPGIPGSPMPANFETVTVDLLEALRLWIRAAAPQTGVVAGTAELLGSCLPPPNPNKMPQPDPPALGAGAQFPQPAYLLGAQSETELCVASYYDLTAPGLVPPQNRIPCPPGAFSGTNPSGECFTHNKTFLALDPQSHHEIVMIYAGAADQTDPGWGAWTCYQGSNAGQPCDPTAPAVCPGGVCGGAAVPGFACTGYGPADLLVTTPNIVVAQESTTTNQLYPQVYEVLPLQGIIVWNSHAFNLTAQDTELNAWLNVDFTADQTYAGQEYFDSRFIFAQDVAPYAQEEYCATVTTAEGTRLFALSSHTHQWGKRFRMCSPATPCGNGGPSPQGGLLTDPACPPCDPNSLIYESFEYSDPLNLKWGPQFAPPYDQPLILSGTVAQRTIKFCALYDNGLSDPAELKLQSTSPPAPPGGVGGPCSDAEVKCVGGANVGQLCFGNDANCPGSVCDACNVKGGSTTGDEMFIAFGKFFVMP